MATTFTKITTRKNLDPDKTGNSETGETFSSERPGSKVMTHEDTGLVNTKYDSFTITNDEAMEVIEQHYTASESHRIVKMTRMVNDCTNELKQKDDVPHSTTTLMATMGYNRNTFYIFIRKLIHHDIVHITLRSIDNKFVKTIVLNPYIARRSKLQESLSKTFKDITKGLNTIVLEDLPKFPSEGNATKSLTSK